MSIEIKTIRIKGEGEFEITIETIMPRDYYMKLGVDTKQRYIGYSKREAVRRFKEYIRERRNLLN